MGVRGLDDTGMVGGTLFGHEDQNLRRVARSVNALRAPLTRSTRWTASGRLGARSRLQRVLNGYPTISCVQLSGRVSAMLDRSSCCATLPLSDSQRFSSRWLADALSGCGSSPLIHRRRRGISTTPSFRVAENSRYSLGY